MSRIANKLDHHDGDQDVGGYLQVAAHSLCDQLNQILNISAGLALDSIGFNNRQEFIDTLANASSRTKSKNDLLKKTLSSVESSNRLSSSDLSVNETGDEKASSRSPSSSSAKFKFINRSHTFHAEQNATRRRRLNPTTKTSQRLHDMSKADKDGEAGRAKNLKLVSTEDEIVELEKLDGYKTTKINSASNRTAKSFLKTGRRLFTWNRKSNAAAAKRKNEFERVDMPYLFNNVRASSAVEEQLINLIAAKLMSENIELAQQPYSDEYGFCKIPIALIRRYSMELKRSIELVAKCMETERLSQLEKCAKVGVS